MPLTHKNIYSKVRDKTSMLAGHNFHTASTTHFNITEIVEGIGKEISGSSPLQSYMRWAVHSTKCLFALKLKLHKMSRNYSTETNYMIK